MKSAMQWIAGIMLLGSCSAFAQQPSIEEMQQRARALETQYRELAELTRRGVQANSLASIGYTTNEARFTGLEWVATEITQILNNIQLALQLIEQIKMVRLQTDQLTDMLANSRRADRFNFKDLTSILNRTEQRLNQRLNGWASVFAPNHRMSSQESIVASFRNLYGHRYDRPAGMSSYEEMAWRRLEGQLEGSMQAVAAARESSDDIQDDMALLQRLAGDIVNSRGRQQTLQAQAQLDSQDVQQSIRMREQLNQLVTLMARQQANDYSREMADRRAYQMWSDPQGRSAAPLNYRGR